MCNLVMASDGKLPSDAWLNFNLCKYAACDEIPFEQMVQKQLYLNYFVYYLQ